jgi:aldehyde dehydrogenase (NAD+)
VTTTSTVAPAHAGETLPTTAAAALIACGADSTTLPGTRRIDVRTPLTGHAVAALPLADADDMQAAIERAHAAFLHWRSIPPPVRGQLVKRLGELLSEHKQHLADLITIEVGKIRSEALGEIQEMIDICDFAVGLSRQLNGRTMPSERPGHRLMETWHPLGVVGVISAFNFPAAVWSWNTALALVCGDTVVWKPSERTPLVALAASALLDRAAREQQAPIDVNVLVITDSDGAAPLIDSPLVPLISATGSERLGAQIAPRIAARFGRAILELGGNNAAIVTPSADLDLAVRGIVFAAAGTGGQRCTTLRRLIVHEAVAATVVDRVATAYRNLVVGDAFDAGTLVGPLFSEQAYQDMQAALAEAVACGGRVVTGGERVDVGHDDAFYVRPAIVTMPVQADVVRRETFAPILYVLTYDDLDEAIALHNAVPQGLSSSIFTQDQREAEIFLSAEGSDCGIVNVNIGTSGAEIGGAFGGEKTTGGGRESGSDAWRAYMRRATNTVNYSRSLPLAQGVSFG